MAGYTHAVNEIIVNMQYGMLHNNNCPSQNIVADDAPQDSRGKMNQYHE